MSKIRVAQYGSKHSHAEGKLSAILSNPDTEFVGVFEPDLTQRQFLQTLDGPYGEVSYLSDVNEILQDDSITLVTSEGRNIESLDQTEQLVNAGKHVWFDKPAGDNWPQWQNIIANAQKQSTFVQVGYMFRYHGGFKLMTEWANSGFLGDIFGIRAHMSKNWPEEARKIVGKHLGGVFYDLGSHMLDQIVWVLGRPSKVTSFLRNDTGIAPEFMDNTLGVFEYDNAMAIVDLASMEVEPIARRFEIHGTKGSAILEPMEPPKTLKLNLSDSSGEYRSGENIVSLPTQTREDLYVLELDSLLKTINGTCPPARSYSHELIVQETLLRGTGRI